MPPAVSVCVTSPARSTTPDNSACITCVLLSQLVVTTDVATAPDSVRRKFIRPAADAVSCSSTRASASVVIGTKKNGRPSPIASNGPDICQNVMSVVANVRSANTPPSQVKPKNTSLRGSTFVDSNPAAGAQNTASTPVHAVARPAHVDV